MLWFLMNHSGKPLPIVRSARMLWSTGMESFLTRSSASEVADRSRLPLWIRCVRLSTVRFPILWNLYRNRTVRQIQLNNYCLHPLFHFNSFYGAPCGIVFFTVGCFISTDAYIVFFFLSQILKGYLCGFSFDCQRLCIFHFLWSGETAAEIKKQ